MNRISALLKLTLRVIIWIALGFVILFIVIALLIQIPSVQTKITTYAISFVSSKTHTRVELGGIRISFPKSVVIKGLYLEDIQKDTLLYAGEAKVNIAFRDLFRNRIHLNSFALEEVILNLNRTEADSLFNFNFLITAFSDTGSKKKVKPETGSKWTIRVDKVDMKGIRFKYDDAYGGTYAAIDLKHLKLKIDQMDLAQSNYSIDELLVESLTADVLINKSAGPDGEVSQGVLPQISAKKIEISDANLSYGDSVIRQSVVAGIYRLKLKDASIDLEKQIVSSARVFLSKSDVRYQASLTDLQTDTAVLADDISGKNNDWKVSVQRIELDDNSLAYHIENTPVLKNVFDVNHMDYRHLTLDASDFYYSPLKTEVSVKEFTAVDQNNFSITEFETDFLMDQHSISAKKLKVRTDNSTIDADLNIQFSSLGSLKDSLQTMILNADMKNVSVRTCDIVYFNNQLARQPFFKNGMTITTVSGIVNGPINNLNAKNLVIKTGRNTILKTDFVIKGLPDFRTAYYNLPNLKITSGKRDIVMMAGSAIPDSIDLPENISLRIYFKGQMNSFVSTLGMNSSFGSADISASVDKRENFRSKVKLQKFDLGSLLKNKTMYGPVSLTAETNGQGLDKRTVKAKIKADVSEIFLNKYTYHSLNVNGNITGMAFEGEINLDDENAQFDFDGLVNLNPKEELYKFNLNVKGADLRKLQLTNNDIRISMMAVADLKGGSANEINGTAGITQILIAQGDKKYLLESFLLASINEPKNSELTVSNALVGIKYKGTFSPAFLAREINRFMNNYFPFSEPGLLANDHEPQDFNFEVQLHNHPILSELFLPGLKEFEPGLIKGSFDSQKKDLKLSASMQKIVYGTTEIKDLLVDVNSDEKAINYKITSSRISSPQFNLDNFLIGGKLADGTIHTTVSSIDEKQNKKLLIRSQIVKEGGNYKLTLDPGDFYLMDDRWDLAADNYIAFGKEGFLIHHLYFNKAESQVKVTSVHDRFNDDLSILINNFKLDDISGIIAKDTSLVKGTVDGNILLKRVNNAYGLISDVAITNLVFREVPVGNLSVKAENATTEKFDIDVNLSGTDNKLTVVGYFIPKGDNNSFNIKADIESLSMKTVEAFSMGAITEGSGSLTGNFLIAGKADAPEVTGELTFNNVFVKPSVINNLLELKHETVRFEKDGIHFKSFTIHDTGQHTAIVNGAVNMKNFANFNFALDVKTQDFQLFNTTSRDNKEFFGRMIIDSRIDIRGPMSLPVVDAKIKMKKGSNFTFAVPEDKLTTYKGEDVVEIDNALKINPILNRDGVSENQKSGFTGFDVSAIIEIDKEATLRLLMDPTSSDSLVVKGEAALNFTMDRSGKMSLTGAYNLNDGSYLVSLESVVKRKFMIDPGSTIIWNGDPLDAAISIDAIYSVRTSPIDLVIDQMVGLSDADKNKYKQRHLFLVILKLRGDILHPEISFEIQLPPEDKGILNGTVNAKLNLLNEDPSALNKQVFALLVLGRFIQENPLQTDANNGASALVRTTVGKFLSSELNKLSSKVVPGVELNFDVQSYDDYESGQAEGRTQVDIGLKKQLFNERLSVQVGGVVDVEGAKVKENSASDITSDVTVEYKLTKDGRYRLKGFTHNQYEGAIEGQLVETGFGILYVRDFDKWREFFKAPKTRIDSTKNEKQ